MPLLALTVIDKPVPDADLNPLVPELSALLADATGKPEQYVMVLVQQAEGAMGGARGPAALAEVRGIGGLTKSVNGRICERLCACLQERLGIDPARVYVNFSDIAAANWGWNSSTFG